MRKIGIMLNLAILATMLTAFASVANALEPTVVTFDDGVEGWTAGPDCQPIVEDGGNPGAHWNFANRNCDGSWVVRAFFRTWNDTHPAFVGDYTGGNLSFTLTGPPQFLHVVFIAFRDGLFQIPGFSPILLDPITLIPTPISGASPLILSVPLAAPPPGVRIVMQGFAFDAQHAVLVPSEQVRIQF